MPGDPCTEEFQVNLDFVHGSRGDSFGTAGELSFGEMEGVKNRKTALFITELQKERGLSSIYTVSGGEKQSLE